MKFFVPVLDYPSGRPLLEAMEGEAFAEHVLQELDENFFAMRRVVAATTRGGRPLRGQ